MASFRDELLSRGLVGNKDRIDVVLNWLFQQNICCLRDLAGLTEFRHFASGGRILSLLSCVVTLVLCTQALCLIQKFASSTCWLLMRQNNSNPIRPSEWK